MQGATRGESSAAAPTDHQPSRQDLNHAFQTSDLPLQPLLWRGSVNVNQRSENHRFGLDGVGGKPAPPRQRSHFFVDTVFLGTYFTAEG